MQHLRIATYGINKGSFQELADTARTGMLPKFQEQPGFVRYGLADLGDKTCLSISVWRRGSRPRQRPRLPQRGWGEHLADRIELRTNSVGDLAFFKGVPATV